MEEYFGRVRSDLQAAGADVDEVADDIRAHVEREAASLRLGVVTEEDVGKILGRIGVPDATLAGPTRVQPVAESNGAPVPPEALPGKRSARPGYGVLFFGIVLPFITVVLEFLTGVCAGVLFDPYPTVAHVLLTLAVPGVNFWLWWSLRNPAVPGGGEKRAAVSARSRWRPSPGWTTAFAGAAIAVAGVYSLLLLPFSPLAVLGIAVYGLGFIPLSPFFAFFTGIYLFRQFRAANGYRRLRPFRLGLAGAMLALALLALPAVITRQGLQMAMAEEPATRARGIRLLRFCGEEEDLLRACYGRANRPAQMYNFGKPVPAEAARKIYYQVRGRSFNSVPPPKLYSGRARWSVLEEEFTWDNDQGGDAVAGRVKGLSLLGSRQDVVIEPDAAMAYCEWTIEFNNNSTLQREARAQVLLPPGAVVSRLTLWIDGEEREAAFGGRSQVKTAYKQVVAKRRDPVLVTTCGPDRVLVQCFPVPPNGGRMKARLGITAPLQLDSFAEGSLQLPAIVERNFTVNADARHRVWIDSPQPLRSLNPSLTGGSSKPNWHSLRGGLSEADLSGFTVIRAQRDPAITSTWSKDDRQGEPAIVRQVFQAEPGAPAGNIVVVVDGAIGMQGTHASLGAALSRIPEGVEFRILQAFDGVREIAGSQRATKETLAEAARALRRADCTGGQDNAPALLQAWDIASRSRNGVVVWVHGPQPERFETFEALRQALERRPGEVRLITAQVQAGPNRIIEDLDGMSGIECVPRAQDLEENLKRCLASLDGSATTVRAVRERQVTFAAGPGGGIEASLHAARLWAFNECARLHAKREDGAASKLATQYQLVTPVSGAVVLETQQQYENAGLSPVPGSTVPIIPEPSSGVLLLLGLLVFAWRRRFAGRDAAG